MREAQGGLRGEWQGVRQVVPVVPREGDQILEDAWRHPWAQVETGGVSVPLDSGEPGKLQDLEEAQGGRQGQGETQS